MKDFKGKWRERLQFTLLFLVLAIALHSLLGWFQIWLKPADPYRVPQGRAAKVFVSGSPGELNGSPGDRLRLFFWYGE